MMMFISFVIESNDFYIMDDGGCWWWFYYLLVVNCDYEILLVCMLLWIVVINFKFNMLMWNWWKENIDCIEF